MSSFLVIQKQCNSDSQANYVFWVSQLVLARFSFSFESIYTTNKRSYTFNYAYEFFFGYTLF